MWQSANPTHKQFMQTEHCSVKGLHGMPVVLLFPKVPQLA